MNLKIRNIKEILSKYNIGVIKNKTLIYDGWNTSYKILTTNGTYILKILNFQNKKGILMELDILQRLKNKIPTVFPLKAKNNRKFIYYRNKIIIILPFLKGKPVLRGERLSSQNLEQFGRYYGIIHTESNLKKIPSKNAYRQVQKVLSNLKKYPHEYRKIASAIKLLRVHGFHQANYPRGLIHADLHTENILVSKECIVAILDFEEAHVDYFIYDLGIAILDTCWKNGAISQSRVKSFLKGYESVRKLSLLEKKHLNDAIIFAGLYTLHWLIKKNGPKNNKNLEHYVVKRFLSLMNSRN